MGCQAKAQIARARRSAIEPKQYHANCAFVVARGIKQSNLVIIG